MRNDTYVCFDDRRVARGRSGRRCPLCQQPMTNIGWRLRVPKITDDRGWRRLHDRIQEQLRWRLHRWYREQGMRTP